MTNSKNKKTSLARVKTLQDDSGRFESMNLVYVWDIFCAFVFGALLASIIFKFIHRRRITSSGYVRKRRFLGREVFEHRQIAESVLGRSLYREEVVHHINGRRRDNRVSNLCVMLDRDHDAYHRWYNNIFSRFGKYPRRETQLRKLREDFGGLLLEDIVRRKSG